MPSIISQSLFAVALLSVAVVEAAPTANAKNIEKSKATAANLKGQVTGKSLRRAKRQIVLEDVPEPSEEEQLRAQLSELSDEQLQTLADIVQSEIDKYEPGQLVDTYEIVEIPEYLTAPVELYPRDRRAVPMDLEDVQEVEEDDEPTEVVVVPEEVLLDALQEEQDELELRERIAEIASILNERATRRVRLF